MTRRFTVDLRAYPGRPLRCVEGVLLGEDAHGISGEERIAKPDVRIYEIAAQRARRGCGRPSHVGGRDDDGHPGADVAGLGVIALPPRL